MSCSPFDLKDYFLKELPDASRRPVEDHLRTCPACREELDRLRLTEAALFALRDEEVPQRIGFVSDEVFEPARWRRWWGAFWGSAGAIGLRLRRGALHRHSGARVRAPGAIRPVGSVPAAGCRLYLSRRSPEPHSGRRVGKRGPPGGENEEHRGGSPQRPRAGSNHAGAGRGIESLSGAERQRAEDSRVPSGRRNEGPAMKLPVALLPLVVACICAGQTEIKPPSPTVSAPVTVETPRVSPQVLAQLEQAFEDKVKTLKGAEPCNLLGASSGFYLDGYGVVLAMPLDLINTPGISPFHQQFTKQEKELVHRRKLAQLPALKQAAREMVASAAASLPTLPLDRKISVAVRIYYLACGRLFRLAPPDRRHRRPQIRAGRRHPSGRTVTPTESIRLGTRSRRALPAPGRDAHRARQDRARRARTRARVAARARRQDRQDHGRHGADRPARHAGRALRTARHPPGGGGPASAVRARN